MHIIYIYIQVPFFELKRCNSQIQARQNVKICQIIYSQANHSKLTLALQNTILLTASLWKLWQAPCSASSCESILRVSCRKAMKLTASSEVPAQNRESS